MTAARLERVVRYHWSQAYILTFASAVRNRAIVPTHPSVSGGSWWRWATDSDGCECDRCLHPAAVPYREECPDCGAPAGQPCFPSCPRYQEDPS
jgi:hypothetical protein